MVVVDNAHHCFVRKNRDALIADCKAAKKILCDRKDIDAELAELQLEIEVVSGLSRQAIFEAAHPTGQSASGFAERNNGYLERLEAAQTRVAELEAEAARRQNTARLLDRFIRRMKDSPSVLTEFDEKLWAVTVDSATVYPDGRMVFRFRDGSEVEG